MIMLNEFSNFKNYRQIFSYFGETLPEIWILSLGITIFNPGIEFRKRKAGPPGLSITTIYQPWLACDWYTCVHMKSNIWSHISGNIVVFPEPRVGMISLDPWTISLWNDMLRSTSIPKILTFGQAESRNVPCPELWLAQLSPVSLPHSFRMFDEGIDFGTSSEVFLTPSPETSWVRFERLDSPVSSVTTLILLTPSSSTPWSFPIMKCKNAQASFSRARLKKWQVDSFPNFSPFQ